VNSRTELANILIVEDEAIVALDLEMQLRELGYAVTGIADSGDKALALARGRHPDLILMDVRLKGAMDGVQVAQVVRRELDVPVIFVTSYSDSSTVRRAAEAGPYGYLTKPFEVKELHAGIEVALYKARMERRLRESERWFTSTLRCVQDGVLIAEADGRVRFLNLAAEALTGWPMMEAVGHPIAELLRFGGPPEAQTSAALALEQGRVVGVKHARRLLARDGHEVPVDESAAPIDDELGRRLGAVVVLRDVTERLQHEERLRASEQRFRSAFDHAPLGMALVSLDGHFLQVNEALCRLLNVDAASCRDRAVAEAAWPEDLAREQACLHELVCGDAAVVQFEQRYRRRGSEQPLHTLVSVSLLREAGQAVCTLYQVHDLTAQRKAAEQLAEIAAERMKSEAAEMASRATNEFLARMSHELRTPLNAVLGFAQLMKLNVVADDARVAAYTEHILQAGRHLLALIDDVLDLQRVTSGHLNLHLQPLSLQASVAVTQQFLSPLAAQHQVRFEDAVAPDLLIRADEMRLRQVLLNVGSNAVKYNRPGGSVSWRTESAPPGRVRLVVQDTGGGIAPEALAHMFQPFDRLGKERSGIPGTGLGLLIARSMMEAMGGTLSLSSELGVGTTVCLEFAAADDQSPAG
jgi:PAS domain S-box-containing protein